MTDPTRGVLFPEQLPRFTRVAPAQRAAELVAWLWVSQWDLPPGEESRQNVLRYPAANLVVEPGGVTLWGATTRSSDQVLRGSGWAVGAVLRPAALMSLTAAPRDLVDSFAVVGAPDLHSAVPAAMPDERAGADAVSQWLIAHTGAMTAEALLANAMSDLLIADASILRVEDAARRLRISTRTLQRLANRAVGVSPSAMIRRRRLQDAAQRVREGTSDTLAEVAAELGYADQAHLAADFRAILGLSATEYHRLVHANDRSADDGPPVSPPGER